MVDTTFRWWFVAIVTVVLLTMFSPLLLRKQFPVKPLLYGVGIGVLLIVVGVFLSLISGDTIIGALLLQAQFGFPVPNSEFLGYGRWIMCGYALLLASAVILAIGYCISWLRRFRKSREEA